VTAIETPELAARRAIQRSSALLVSRRGRIPSRNGGHPAQPASPNGAWVDFYTQYGMTPNTTIDA
jgi:hypothetical protein